MGAPRGNQNAVKAKRWQQAIDRALERRAKADGIAELDRLADVYLDAIEEMTAGTEKRGPSIAGFADLADRLDGKPTVQVDMNVTRTTRELDDDELNRIAAGGREGTSGEAQVAQEPGQLH